MVSGYVYVSPFFPPSSHLPTFFFFSCCTLGQHLCSFQLHQPCLLGVIDSFTPSFSSTSSPCFSTHACLGNRAHLGEIEVCQLKRGQRAGAKKLILHPGSRLIWRPVSGGHQVDTSRYRPNELNPSSTHPISRFLFFFSLCLLFWASPTLSVSPPPPSSSGALNLWSTFWFAV